jgi:SAM-dependent methyltransferase
MIALLGYPFLFEPNIATRTQAIGWSIGFALFAVLIIAAARFAMRTDVTTAISDEAAAAVAEPAPPTWREKLLWAALSAMGSILLLAISNHLTQNISSIPLLWVVPLALYLLTFIITFDGKGLYQRKLMLPLLAIVLVAMSWTLADPSLHFALKWQISVFSIGLFIACMFCHGELVERKPSPKYLTQFYLMISVGGAVGAALVGIVAPLTLTGYYELEASLVGLGVLATLLHWRFCADRPDLPKWLGYTGTTMGMVVSGFCIGATIVTMRTYNDDVVYQMRNFYGTLRVKEYLPPEVQYRRRSLIHGAILHGDQYMDPPYDRSATTYYKPKSGIGLTLVAKETLNPGAPRRVGLVGLGAGTLATYGNKGDTFRFYDINAAVVEIAKRDFTYLKQSEATIEIALGDARLNLEREASQAFDVLAIDAFSSDSIPVHLITLEALDIYAKHMKPDGVIAFHVSNRFLDLKPVVQMLADKRGWHTAWVRDTYDDGSTTSDWILLTRQKSILLRKEIVDATYIIPPEPGWRIWTDDFNNLLQVMK